MFKFERGSCKPGPPPPADEGASDGPDGRQGRQEREGWVPGSGGVALVLLAEAHASLAAPLGHAHVVHHEHVDVDVVGAAAPDLHVG